MGHSEIQRNSLVDLIRLISRNSGRRSAPFPPSRKYCFLYYPERERENVQPPSRTTRGFRIHRSTRTPKYQLSDPVLRNLPDGRFGSTMFTCAKQHDVEFPIIQRGSRSLVPLSAQVTSFFPIFPVLSKILFSLSRIFVLLFRRSLLQCSLHNFVISMSITSIDGIYRLQFTVALVPILSAGSLENSVL